MQFIRNKEKILHDTSSSSQHATRQGLFLQQGKWMKNAILPEAGAAEICLAAALQSPAATAGIFCRSKYWTKMS